MKINFIKAI